MARAATVRPAEEAVAFGLFIIQIVIVVALAVVGALSLYLDFQPFSIAAA